MISAKWDLTSTCNLRCKHCSVAEMYFTDAAPAELPLSDRLRIVDRLSEGGVQYLSLLGGEPLTLGEDLFRLMEHAKARGIRVGIVTNGQLLNPATSQRLLDCELASLVVSIESPNAKVHNDLRGKKTFERLLENVTGFIALRGNREFPTVAVNTVLSRPNRDTFTQMIPFCRDLGVDSWTALTLNYIGNATKNLNNLALSDEEHTEVAVEIGQYLKTPGLDLGNLDLNLTIVCPLVWESICKKHDLHMPQPQICCSAGISLLYISPTGELFPCDRIPSSGYSGCQLETATMQPMSLLTHSFEEIWNSTQYLEMFSFIKRAETYANFEPCNHCKYLVDRTCNPCPLQSYRDETVRFEECLKAESFLGDISTYDAGPRTQWESDHALAKLDLPAVEPDRFNQFRSRYPRHTIGVRYVEQENGEALLVHPRSAELIRINALGNELWKAMDGLKTTDEIVAEAVDLFNDVAMALDRRISSNDVQRFERENVIPFVVSMREKGFVSFDQNPYPTNERLAGDDHTARNSTA